MLVPCGNLRQTCLPSEIVATAKWSSAPIDIFPVRTPVCDFYVALKIPYIHAYDFIIKLFRRHAEVIQRKVVVFRVVAPFRLIEVHRRFRDACCLYHHGGDEVPETASTSKMSVISYQSTRRNNPEGSHLHARKREDRGYLTEVIQNDRSRTVSSVGQGGAQYRKHKRLKLGGGRPCD
jgi:hypothetical protein